MSRLLLIDSRVTDVESILATLTPETDGIVFDYLSDTFETIQSKIVKPYVSVAIAQHKYGNPTFQLVEAMSPASLDNLEETDPELTSWAEFSAFVLWLKTNGADTVDLLACDLWADMNWRYAIQKMRDTMNITIRASIDITGADGNFILESDNADMVGLYFTPEISNYKYNFVAPSAPTITSLVAGLNSAFVTFDCGNANGSGSITAVSYRTSTNGGSTYGAWTTFTGTYNDVSGSGTIALTYTGNAYLVQLRQTTSGGNSVQSNSVSVTPYGVPSAPTSLVVGKHNRYNGVVITFTLGATNGGGPVTKIEYNIGGTGWVDTSFSNLFDSSCIFVPLTYTATADYSITLRQTTQTGGTSTASSAVVVYPNGILEYSFGTRGYVNTDVSGGSIDYITDMQFDASNNIVAVGTTSTSAGADDAYILVRYTPNGTLDTTFGTNGIARLNYYGIDNRPPDLVIGTNGKITTCGSVKNANGSDRTVIAQFNSNGTLNTSFGTNGLVIRNNDIFVGIKINSTGKFVVCGYTTLEDLINRDMLLSCYNANGTPNTSFGSNGTVTVTPSAYNYGLALHILSDDKILVTGGTYQIANGACLLYKYNSDGTPDTSFGGTDGNVLVDIDTASQDAAHCITVDTFGKILIAGMNNNTDIISLTNNSNFAIARLTSAGDMDNTFSGDGKLITTFSGSKSRVSKISIDKDDKIVVCGILGRNSNANEEYIIAKYNNDGSVYSTYGLAGYITDDRPDLTDSNTSISMLIDNNNDIILGGGNILSPSTTADIFLVKYDDKSVNSDYPIITSITKPNTTTITVNYNLGATNGTGTVTRVEYSIDAGTTWTILPGTFNTVDGSGTITVPANTNSVTLNLRQYTVNGGYSAQTPDSVINMVSQSSTVPDPPTITTTPFVSSQITVNFTAPSSDGGSAIQGYKYSYDAGSNYTTIADPTATQIVISNMTLSSYTIWLKAYNSVGDSSYAEILVTRPSTTNVSKGNSSPEQETIFSLTTYSYSPSYLLPNETFTFTLNSIPGSFLENLNFSAGTYFLKNNALQTLSTMVVDTSTNSITFTNVSSGTFTVGPNTLFLYKSSGGVAADTLIGDAMVVNVACLLEGTKILTFDTRRNQLRYIPIQKLKPGMRVKTLSSGFVPIKHIGYSTMYNPGPSKRVKDQLFIYKKTAYPELIEDLVLTGTHSILVEEITDVERTHIIDTLGKIYITEDRYRLPAFNDTRAVQYEHCGEFRIWNLALENESYTGNYGIYANGLLVETTSCRYMTELSGMTLVHK